MERSKKRDLLWKKAILHFSFCFSLGFFLGFTPPSSRRLLFFPEIVPYLKSTRLGFDPADLTPNPTLFTPPSNGTIHLPKLLIAVTTTTSDDPLRWASLERLAQMLRLVPPPLLWIVVGSVGDVEPMAKILRMTGIMYRHLVYKNNDLKDPEVKEVERKRQIALQHIQYHRLDGIVHFADLSNVYDLRLFEEMREIEVVGTWPVALLSANKRSFAIEGPVCESSQVMGWHVKDTKKSGAEEFLPRIAFPGFAFNSSILWDQHNDSSLQDAMNYAREPAVDDESKRVAFPQDCSRVMLWTLHVPSV